MTEHRFSAHEALAAVPDLTPEQLDRYIRVGVIQPVQSDHGPVFRDIDIARLALIVDLADGYSLDDEALGLIMSLLDQLHGLRGDMRAILDAVAHEPPETRASLSRTIREVRVVIRR
ncbi:hypothetical protein PE067_17395 [Paracoccus sp. DMF-8]|uniref:hypothetical protein n=1 Tax=Paracoccus sp. DMF-8 TaxID=3019445 RepID=UPI0023E447DF|nr:hypothetical protein [Paracoccus sp. DMF-8]MDF3607758.1 hypothetical protein [Paracoccus sp. DMF-8]